MFSKLRLFISSLLSILILVITSFITPTYKSHLMYKDYISFGYPFKFIEQQVLYEPMKKESYTMFSPAENPTEILWGQFLLSFLLVFISVYLILSLIFYMRNYVFKK
ncbi:hypothetical protein SAMN05880580_1083 [Priestia flexa]|jgi:hypothetical protein|nr:hypothetical protein SAMN05880580_1083 [Priestia flexa]